MTLTTTPVIAIVLAAGKGTRMKSTLPKVLHTVAGKPMLFHVLDTLRQLDGIMIIPIISPNFKLVEEEVKAKYQNIECAIQPVQRGTGDAVKCAEGSLKALNGYSIIVCGDTPLVRQETLESALQALEDGNDVCVVGMECENPTGYGRLIEKNGELDCIREERDASDEEKKITLCNSGIISAKTDVLFSLLKDLKNDNAQGEYYLTDIIALARQRSLRCGVTRTTESEMIGVNSRAQLAQVESLMQERLRQHWMAEGVTFLAPHTVYLSADTVIGNDTVIEPNVFIGNGVTIGSNVTIKASSHLEGAVVHDHVQIGPFARLRPGTVISSKARVGNFCEIKNATLAEGAKVNHLTYIGDADIGKNTNIGAGTITCNYDGYNKFRTTIGENVFIGSNSALVAPITLADGTLVAAGSTVTHDSEVDDIVITRGEQTNITGAAKRFRDKRKKK